MNQQQYNLNDDDVFNESVLLTSDEENDYNHSSDNSSDDHFTPPNINVNNNINNSKNSPNANNNKINQVNNNSADSGANNQQNASPSSTTFFSIRIVDIDYYMCKPFPNIDVTHSPLDNTPIAQVPIVRVFGSTPAGQKACLHLHKLFPYFFIEYSEHLSLELEYVNTYIRKLVSSINSAMGVGSSDKLTKNQYIFNVRLVRGKPFYGYYPQDKIFIKIFLYNPDNLNKIIGLLRGGSIMGVKFDVYEAHIPFMLQIFLDYNLTGMSFIDFNKVLFRKPLPSCKRLWGSLTQDRSQNSSPDHKNIEFRKWFTEYCGNDFKYWSPIQSRKTTCELEVDGDIFETTNIKYNNYTPIEQSDVEQKLVQSLNAIWSDEIARRKNHGLSTQFTQVHSQARRPVNMGYFVKPLANKKIEAIIDIENQLINKHVNGKNDNENQQLKSPSHEEGKESKDQQTINSQPSFSLNPEMLQSQYFQSIPPSNSPTLSLESDPSMKDINMSRIDHFNLQKQQEHQQLNNNVINSVIDFEFDLGSGISQTEIQNQQKNHEQPQHINDENEEEDDDDEYQNQKQSQKEIKDILASSQPFFSQTEYCWSDDEDDKDITTLRSSGKRKDVNDIEPIIQFDGGTDPINKKKRSKTHSSFDKYRFQTSSIDDIDPIVASQNTTQSISTSQKPFKKTSHAKKYKLNITNNNDNNNNTIYPKLKQTISTTTTTTTSTTKKNHISMEYEFIDATPIPMMIPPSPPQILSLHQQSIQQQPLKSCIKKSTNNNNNSILKTPPSKKSVRFFIPSPEYVPETQYTQVEEQEQFANTMCISETPISTPESTIKQHTPHQQQSYIDESPPTSSNLSFFEPSSNFSSITSSVSETQISQSNIVIEETQLSQLNKYSLFSPSLPPQMITTSNTSVTSTNTSQSKPNSPIQSIVEISSLPTSCNDDVKPVYQTSLREHQSAVIVEDDSPTPPPPLKFSDSPIKPIFIQTPPPPSPLQRTITTTNTTTLYTDAEINHVSIQSPLSPPPPSYEPESTSTKLSVPSVVVNSPEPLDIQLSDLSPISIRFDSSSGEDINDLEVMKAFSTTAASNHLLKASYENLDLLDKPKDDQNYQDIEDEYSSMNGSPMIFIEDREEVEESIMQGQLDQHDQQVQQDQNVLQDHHDKQLQPKQYQQLQQQANHNESISYSFMDGGHNESLSEIDKSEEPLLMNDNILINPQQQKQQKQLENNNNISNNNSKIFKLLRPPPSNKEIIEEIRKSNNPVTIYKDLYYSNTNDSEKKRVFETPIFKSSISELKGINYWKRLDVESQVANIRRIFTPSIPPPSPKSLLNSRNENSNQSLNNNSNSNKTSNITPPNQENRDLSQLSQSTPNFSYLSKLNPNSQSAQKELANNLNQFLTLLSVEVHVNTRGELSANPEFDGVQAIVYCCRDEGEIEAQGESYKDLHGILMIAPKVDGQQQFHHSHGLPCTVNYYSDELDLLKGFCQLVRNFDVDIFVGFEIQMYSLGYLIERARIIGVSLCDEISRIISPITQNQYNMKSDNFFSKELDRFGYDHSSGISIIGRIVINTWRLLRHEITIDIYTYQNLCFRRLNRRVPEYSSKTLTEWFQSGSQTWRTLSYYLEHTKGNFDLLYSFDIIGRTSELARVYGIDFFSVISRGSQFRVESMLLRLTKPENYIMYSPSREQTTNQPMPESIPLVMDPISKLFNSPVVVLDFQSLYPSIMIGYNYCYSTCLGKVIPTDPVTHDKPLGSGKVNIKPGLLGLLGKNVNVSPNEIMYTNDKTRKGLFPKLLSEVLETRIMIKKAMKRYRTNKKIYNMLDARQLALKMMANVSFGYTAATFSGRMSCIEIADSIVQTARETLETAIKITETCKEWRAKVIYGDTDSLFVLLPGISREEAFVVGQKIADKVTSMNPPPVKLIFEKVYHPTLLANKKRYVGYKYENPSQLVPIFDAKGIETVRRDQCRLVSKIMEKTIRIIFEKKDLSLVKSYITRQWQKIFQERVSLKDYIFAKGVKLGNYSTNGVLPAAAQLATRIMEKDPRGEPRYGERVRYVVVYGTPNSRLCDLVVTPHEYMTNKTLRINTFYYITKQILPSMDRILKLVGVNIHKWFAAFPKQYMTTPNQRINLFFNNNHHLGQQEQIRLLLEQHNQSTVTDPNQFQQYTIDQFYFTMNCFLCGDSISSEDAKRFLNEGTSNRFSLPMCNSCDNDKQTQYFIMINRMNHLESQKNKMVEICHTCIGQQTYSSDIECQSLDCDTFYERIKLLNLFRNMNIWYQSTINESDNF